MSFGSQPYQSGVEVAVGVREAVGVGVREGVGVIVRVGVGVGVVVGVEEGGMGVGVRDGWIVAVGGCVSVATPAVDIATVGVSSGNGASVQAANPIKTSAKEKGFSNIQRIR